MRMKIYGLLSLVLLTISGTELFAQSAAIKINFGTPPTTSVFCRTRIEENNYLILVPASLRPEVSTSQTLGVRLDGNDVIFSLKIEPGVTTTCKSDQGGLEIAVSSSIEISNKLVSQQDQTVGKGDSLPPTERVLEERDMTTTATQPPPANVNSQIPNAGNDDSTKEVKKEATAETLDLSVPESPGFTILGLNPQNVVRPATPREFVTTLLSGLDEHGNFQTGVAIDTAPYLLLAGSDGGVDRAKYQNLGTDGKPRFSLVRFASRIQFSLATTKGTTEDDKSARIGTGLHFTIFDKGDPRMDTLFSTCFRDFVKNIEREIAISLGINPDPLLQTGPEFDRVGSELKKSIATYREKIKKECVEPSRKRNFARSSFIVGGAGSWTSPTGDSGKFKYSGAGIWASLAYGFEGLPGLEQKAQLIFHFRRRIKEIVPDPIATGMFTTKDSNLFGARLRFGSPNWTANLEGSYRGEHYAGRAPDSNFQLSLGSDYKLSDNLYLNFSIGGETKKSNVSDGKVFVRTSFNWGTSQKRTIKVD